MNFRAPFESARKLGQGVRARKRAARDGTSLLQQSHGAVTRARRSGRGCGRRLGRGCGGGGLGSGGLFGALLVGLGLGDRGQL